MRTDTFEMMMGYLTRNFGATGLSISYSMGVANGKYEVAQIREELKRLEAPATKKELLEKSLQRLTAMGWGKLKLAELNTITGENTVTVEQNPFREGCDPKDNGGCYFLQGFVAGVVSETLEEDVTYIDTRCTHEDLKGCSFHLMRSKSKNL